MHSMAGPAAVIDADRAVASESDSANRPRNRAVGQCPVPKTSRFVSGMCTCARISWMPSQRGEHVAFFDVDVNVSIIRRTLAAQTPVRTPRPRRSCCGSRPSAVIDRFDTRSSRSSRPRIRRLTESPRGFGPTPPRIRFALQSALERSDTITEFHRDARSMKDFNSRIVRRRTSSVGRAQAVAAAG